MADGKTDFTWTDTKAADKRVERGRVAEAKLRDAEPHVAALREWMGIDGQIGLGEYFDDLGRLLDILERKTD